MNGPMYGLLYRHTLPTTMAATSTSTKGGQLGQEQLLELNPSSLLMRARGSIRPTEVQASIQPD